MRTETPPKEVAYTALEKLLQLNELRTPRFECSSRSVQYVFRMENAKKGGRHSGHCCVWNLESQRYNGTPCLGTSGRRRGDYNKTTGAMRLKVQSTNQ